MQLSKFDAVITGLCAARMAIAVCVEAAPHMPVLSVTDRRELNDVVTSLVDGVNLSDLKGLLL